MKFGFVSLVGHSNVGKSTILNLLSHQKISIVTPKKQTTRNNISNIIDGDNFQIIINDTPGFYDAKNILGKRMNKKIIESIKKSDLVILVLSAREIISKKKFKFFFNKKIDLIILNKIDLIYVSEAEIIKKKIHEFFPKKPIIEMCAIKDFNSDFLLKNILVKLQDSDEKKIREDFFLKKNDIFYSKEIIRETIFLNLKKELPYHTAIYVNNFKTQNDLVEIDASIIVNKKSQKIIMIGKNGQMLKKIRLISQKQLKKYFKKKVLINLFVKIKEDWFNSISFLKELGY